jgi:hypothetical protein
VVGPVAVGVDAGERRRRLAVRRHGEGLVVAVGVDDRHEPLVGAGEVVGVGDDVGEQPPLDLGRDPVAPVLGGGVERRGMRAGAAVDAVGDELLAAARSAVDDALDRAGVRGRQVVVERLEVLGRPAGDRARAGARAGARHRAPGPEHVLPGGGGRRRRAGERQRE